MHEVGALNYNYFKIICQHQKLKLILLFNQGFFWGLYEGCRNIGYFSMRYRIIRRRKLIHIIKICGNNMILRSIGYVFVTCAII